MQKKKAKQTTKAQQKKASSAPAKADKVEKVEEAAEEAAPPAEAPKVEKKAAKEAREIVAVYPSERKAVVKVNGVVKKAVYDVSSDKVPMLGCHGEKSVNADDWVAGKAHLKGLQA